MDYIDTIRNNYNSKVCTNSWWTKFAFHYTDIRNAVGILNSGVLYCRNMAMKSGLMANDNASGQILENTKYDVLKYVRFYFRPKTPTQYYNEGYKFRGIRYLHESNANVPVPVFFVFKLDSVLSYPGVMFSEMAQSGEGATLYSSPEDFSKLNFKYIYNTGVFTDSRMEKKYRHAEILCPEYYPIKNSLAYICCRNAVERNTLLNMLDDVTFEKYRNIIRSAENTDSVFEKNGFYIENCVCGNDCIIISFNNSYRKKLYYDNAVKYGSSPYKPNSMIIKTKLTDVFSGRIYNCKYEINDYLDTKDFCIDISNLALSEDVLLEIFLDDVESGVNNILMAKLKLSLAESVIM